MYLSTYLLILGTIHVLRNQERFGIFHPQPHPFPLPFVVTFGTKRNQKLSFSDPLLPPFVITYIICTLGDSGVF